jgi:hypothetical protein
MSACLALPVTSHANQPAFHPDLLASYREDQVGMIVKATSAAAMLKACANDFKAAPAYAASLTFLLQDNDRRFGAGSSAKDIATKITEHDVENDCEELAVALSKGLYPNVFIQSAR